MPIKSISDLVNNPSIMVSDSQWASCRESGYLPSELEEISTDWLAAHESELFLRKGSDPATIRQVIALMHFMGEDPSSQTVDSLSTLTHDQARKAISAIIREKDSPHFDARYREETNRRFNAKKNGL